MSPQPHSTLVPAAETTDLRHSPAWLPALPIIAGLAALYGPTYARLAGSLWQDAGQAHAPLVAIVAAYLLWRRHRALAALPADSRPLAGGVTLAIGLLLVLAGARMDSPFLTLVSQLPLLAGVLLLTRGGAGLRLVGFPLVFLAFMVPLPGFFLDAVTSELKAWVSILAEELLHGLGYPVARNGVVITIGQYRLLVADACSGLHSVLSLSALGSLFIYLIGRASRLHSALMLASILPVAFAANLVRVLLLALLTYHLGDATGRVFHELAGMTVFITALLLLFGLDTLFDRGRRLLEGRQP